MSVPAILALAAGLLAFLSTVLKRAQIEALSLAVMLLAVAIVLTL